MANNFNEDPLKNAKRQEPKSLEALDQEMSDELFKITERYYQLVLRKIELLKVPYEHPVEDDLNEMGSIRDNLDRISEITKKEFEKGDPGRNIDKMKEQLDEYEKALDEMKQHKEKLAERWKSGKGQDKKTVAGGEAKEASPSGQETDKDYITWEDAEKELEKQGQMIEGQEAIKDKFIQSTSARRASRDKAIEEAERHDEQAKEAREKGLKNKEADMEKQLDWSDRIITRLSNDAEKREQEFQLIRQESQELLIKMEKENLSLKEQLKLAAEKTKSQPQAEKKKTEKPIDEIIDGNILNLLIKSAAEYARDLDAEAKKLPNWHEYGRDQAPFLKIELGRFIRKQLKKNNFVKNDDDLERAVDYISEEIMPQKEN